MTLKHVMAAHRVNLAFLCIIIHLPKTYSLYLGFILLVILYFVAV